jgi:hypothetical protein
MDATCTRHQFVFIVVYYIFTIVCYQHMCWIYMNLSSCIQAWNLTREIIKTLKDKFYISACPCIIFYILHRGGSRIYFRGGVRGNRALSEEFRPLPSLYSTYSFVHLKYRRTKSKKKKKKRSPSVSRLCSPLNCYYLLRFSDKKGTKGPLPGGGGVRALLGHCFTLKFTRKKGHFLSLVGVYTPNTPPKSAPVTFIYRLWTYKPFQVLFSAFEFGPPSPSVPKDYKLDYNLLVFINNPPTPYQQPNHMLPIPHIYQHLTNLTTPYIQPTKTLMTTYQHLTTNLITRYQYLTSTNILPT